MLQKLHLYFKARRLRGVYKKTRDASTTSDKQYKNMNDKMQHEEKKTHALCLHNEIKNSFILMKKYIETFFLSCFFLLCVFRELRSVLK